MQTQIETLFGPIQQIAYVVEDIEKSMAAWQQQLQLGPFALIKQFNPLQGSQYRGKRSGDIWVNMAFAYMGDLQIELIQPLDQTPSIYQEAKERGLWSAHHYAVFSADFGAAKSHALENGFEIVVSSEKMAYLESALIPGLIIELIAKEDSTEAYFQGVKDFLATVDPQSGVHDFNFDLKA